jgi:hypothetical protein
LYNVAKFGFEWSSFIELGDDGCSLRWLQVSIRVNLSQATQSHRDLMRHRRPVPGPRPMEAHMVRRTDRPLLQVRVSFEATRSGPHHDRGLCPSRADGAAHELTAETRRCAAGQSKDGDRGGIGSPRDSVRSMRARRARVRRAITRSPARSPRYGSVSLPTASPRTGSQLPG